MPCSVLPIASRSGHADHSRSGRSASQDLHGARDATRGAGSHQHMSLIRHLDVCGHGAAFAPRYFAQILQVTQVRISTKKRGRRSLPRWVTSCATPGTSTRGTEYGRNPCKTDVAFSRPLACGAVGGRRKWLSTKVDSNSGFGRPTPVLPLGAAQQRSGWLASKVVLK